MYLKVQFFTTMINSNTRRKERLKTPHSLINQQQINKSSSFHDKFITKLNIVCVEHILVSSILVIFNQHTILFNSEGLGVYTM